MPALPESNLADALAGMGMMWSPKPGDIVVDAIVIAKVIREGGQVSLVYQVSDGTDFITKMGLMSAAQQMDYAFELEADEGDLED
jgi:hypothetical protein